MSLAITPIAVNAPITFGMNQEAASAALAAKTKTDFLTVTAATNLDTIRTKVDGLDAAIVLIGVWDASVGTFPGSGTAQAGNTWRVSVAGTVNGVSFNIGDRVMAIVDNASTTTFANNWFHEDYTDRVSSVAGRTGDVTLTVADVTGAVASTTTGITGADAITNMVSLTQAEYDAIVSKSSTTLYVIVG